MATILGTLLGVDDRKFKDYIDRLEHVCLRPGVDIRLGAEIITRTRQKIRELDLDVHDTTNRELFFALQHRLVRDESMLKKKLNILDDKENELNLGKIAAQAQKLSSKEYSLGLTAVGAKKILEAVPPKRTLKLLKYRSIQSVLKRHDARVLYALASVVENESWHSQVHAWVRRLNTKDIQWQKICVSVMPLQWYEKAHKYLASKGALLMQEELGMVCMLPVVEVKKPGATLLVLGMVLQAATTIATKSLPYKQQSLHHGFESIIPKIASGEYPALNSIHGLMPSWRMVYQLVGERYLTLQHEDTDLEVFDLFWESTEMKLASVVGEMDFWVDTHFLGTTGKNGIVSLHILDVAIALVGDIQYGSQSNIHLSSSLWNELQIRYLKEEVLLKSLSNQLSKPSVNMIGY